LTPGNTTKKAALAVICSLASAAVAQQWNEMVLYSFQGGTDGVAPVGAIVFDKAGNLYGATQSGGASNCDSPYPCGTVYKLTPPVEEGGEWTETMLYVFKGYAYGDGASPQGGLVIDDAGNLYGTTGYGGTGSCLLLGGPVGCGSVYELSPPTQAGDPWTETVLYSFQGGNDGYVAAGDLAFDKAGNLYGATLFGGGKGTTCDILYGGNCGTVFKLSPPQQQGGQWTERVLHSFGGIAEGEQNGDGATPNGDLVIDGNGAIYGTTETGGFNCLQYQGAGCGTVFQLRPPAQQGEEWREKIVHAFTDGDDGAGPNGGLVSHKDALYGVTGLGGSQDSGVVFQIAEANGGLAETVLQSFQGTKFQANPQLPVFDLLGNMYCSAGGIVRLKPPKVKGGSWTLTVLYGFEGPPNGRTPLNLAIGAGPAVYGITSYGGTGQCQGGCGTVFEVWP
jgi:hypothetical protein